MQWRQGLWRYFHVQSILESFNESKGSVHPFLAPLMLIVMFMKGFYNEKILYSFADYNRRSCPVDRSGEFFMGR